jgi:hypothetical protein
MNKPIHVMAWSIMAMTSFSFTLGLAILHVAASGPGPQAVFA